MWRLTRIIVIAVAVVFLAWIIKEVIRGSDDKKSEGLIRKIRLSGIWTLRADLISVRTVLNISCWTGFVLPDCPGGTILIARNRPLNFCSSCLKFLLVKASAVVVYLQIVLRRYLEYIAEVVELVDSPGSGPGGRKPVGVRVPPSAFFFFVRPIRKWWPLYKS